MVENSRFFKMNGILIDPTPNSIMANALELFDDIQYRSKDNLIEILIGINQLVIDWLKVGGKTSKKYQQARLGLRRKKEYLTRDQALQLVYNEILRLEDRGYLRGFGVSNKYKDTINSNPEIQPIVRINKDKVNN